MFAAQLIRILDTLPTPAKSATCVFDTDESYGNMKESQTGILLHINSPRRYSDPLATEINNKDSYCNTPELECAMVMDDFTNVNESEVKRSHSQLQSEIFQNETDFYTDKNITECELPELMICYKEGGAYNVVKDICVDEGMNSEEKNLVENCKVDHEALSDIVKGSLVTESCTQNILRSSSAKNDGLNAANECGTQENIDSALLTHDSHNDISSVLSNKDNSDLGEKGDHTDVLIQDEEELGGSGHNDINLPVARGIQESSEDSDDINFSEFGRSLNIEEGTTNDCSQGDVVQTVEESVPPIDKLMYDASAEESDSNSMSSAKTFLPQTSLKFLLNSSEFGANGDDDDDEQQPHQIHGAEISKTPDSISDFEEVSSSGQAAAISEEETSEDDHATPMENDNFDDLTKASQEQYSVGETSFSVAGPIKGLPTFVGPVHEDEASDTASLARLIQRGDNESSFSVGGPVSARITYSGQIPYSGSISLRSESSTTSTRSFAFPVLQNEWNSSPVRMRKAERRRLRKHRGWRQGIFCCRF